MGPVNRTIQSSLLLKYVHDAQSSPLSENGARGVACACTKIWGRDIQGPLPPITSDNVHSVKIRSTLENCGPSEHVRTLTTHTCYTLSSPWSS